LGDNNEENAEKYFDLSDCFRDYMVAEQNEIKEYMTQRAQMGRKAKDMEVHMLLSNSENVEL